MLADEILALLRSPMTSAELAKKLRKPESLVLTELRKELAGLGEMESGGKWKRRENSSMPEDEKCTTCGKGMFEGYPPQTCSLCGKAFCLTHLKEHTLRDHK